ncbi:hypothetical protein EII22_01455 [Coriobacteriales bacterium OH1046]|nr:hypothetical protein EII22_01455 [Coriobacteriales bacterium OH1046]
MSGKKAQGMLTGLGVLLVLSAIRVLQLLTLHAESFSPLGVLPSDFSRTTDASISTFALLPLWTLFSWDIVENALSVQVALRRGMRTRCVLHALARLSIRAVIFSLAIVLSGLLIVLARSDHSYTLGGWVSFFSLELALLSLFHLVCAEVLLFCWLVSRSVVGSVVAALAYGSFDYLLSFFLKDEGMTFFIGWRLADISGLTGKGSLAAAALRLLALVVAGALLGCEAARRADFLGNEAA